MADKIRLATANDSDEILKIYAPYIEKTAISFETEVPTRQEFAKRVESIANQYPYLVYLSDDKIVGYAYASKHRERAAYVYDADISIYLDPEYHGKGVAQALYNRLFAILKEQGYYNLYAAYTNPNEKSKRFHEKMGFTIIGTYHNAGYKFDKWYGVTWAEKLISDYSKKPKPIKAISELPTELIEKLLSI